MPSVPKPLRSEHRPMEELILDPSEVARHSDPEKIRLLSEDIRANGQLQPGGGTEDGHVIFGTGRALALRLIGSPTMELKIYPLSISVTQRTLIRASENLHRKDYTGFEKYRICANLLAENPTWRQKDLVDALHVGESMVTHLLSPSKCIPAWQEALEQGRVGISDCYAASKLPESDQSGLLALKFAGASRDAIEKHVRKVRKPANGAVDAGVKRLRLACPGDVMVQFTGPSITIESAIDHMADLTRKLKRSLEQGLNMSTVERTLRDQAAQKPNPNGSAG